MSRRWISLLLALSLVLLPGCGEKEAQKESAFGAEASVFSAEAETASTLEQTAPAITGNGTFSMPYNDSYGWNPFTCRGLENRAVMQLIYEGLFAMNPEFEAEYGLCQSFSVSEDGLVYTLELREAYFSNGRQLQPLDVTYSMEQAQASEIYASRFADIDTFYISENNTVTVTLHTANDQLPCLLTFPIVPNGSGGESAPGTGPFVRASENMLTTNGQWWQGLGNLSFQTVTLFSSASAEDTRDNFEIDNVHFVYNNPSASSAATYHCDYELWNSPNTVMQYIGFNFQAGVFQDEEVRRAVSRAISRSDIVETAYHNFADAAVLPVAPASKMYYEDLVQTYNFTSSQDAMEELLGTSSFFLPEEKIAELKNPEADVLQSESPQPEDGEETPEDDPDGDDADPEEDDPEEPEDGEDGKAEEDEDGEKKETTFNNIVFIVKAGNLSRVTAAQEAAKYLTLAGFTVDLQELEESDYKKALSDREFDIYYSEVALKPDFDLREILLSTGDLYYGGVPENENLRTLLYNAMENNGNRYDLYKYIMEKGYLCPVLFVNHAVFTTRGVFSDLSPALDNMFYQITNIQVNQN